MTTAPLLTFEHILALTQAGRYSYDTESVHPGLMSPRDAKIQLIEAAERAGLVDWERPVDEEGNGAAVVWERAFGSALPPSLLRQMAQGHPTLGLPNHKGQWPLVAMAEHWGSSNPQSYGSVLPERRLQAWMEAVQPVCLQAWDAEGDQPGEGLLRWLAAQKSAGFTKLDTADWRPIVALAMERGLNWTAYGDTLVRGKLPSLLACIIEAGVDLNAQASGQPMWSALLERREPTVTEAVQARLAEQNGASEKALRAVETTTYLAEFSKFREEGHRGGQKAAGATESLRQRTLAHLLSRSDWASVEDSDGRSAFFHAVLAVPGVLRVALERLQQRSATPAECAQWRAALRHRDRKGRNLWFYLIPVSQDNTFTERLLESLREELPSTLDEKGWGWGFQAFADPLGTQRCWVLPGQERNIYSRHLPTPVWSFHKQAAWSVPASANPQDAWELIAEQICRHPGMCGNAFAEWPPVPWAETLREWVALLNDPRRAWSSPNSQSLLTRLKQLREQPDAMSFPIPEDVWLRQSRGLRAKVKTSNPRDEGQALGVLDQVLSVFEQLANHTRLCARVHDTPGSPKAPRVRL